MILPTRSRQTSAGFTVFDILVLMAGFAAGDWVSSYFGGAARVWVFWISSLALGITFWCFIFLWLVPLFDRRRKAAGHPNDHNKPNAA